MRKRSESTKTSIAVATARFIRKAAGRITKREAMKLGRLYGEDLHWKFLGSSGDNLAKRKPGEFVETWEDARFGSCIALTFKRDSRAPKRGHGPYSPDACEIARHMAWLFGWYGPRFGEWPGEWKKVA